MPKQEVFLQEQVGDQRIEVLKTYDPAYARDVFQEMDEGALATLWNSLDIGAVHTIPPIPTISNRSGSC